MAPTPRCHFVARHRLDKARAEEIRAEQREWLVRVAAARFALLVNFVLAEGASTTTAGAEMNARVSDLLPAAAHATREEFGRRLTALHSGAFHGSQEARKMHIFYAIRWTFENRAGLWRNKVHNKVVAPPPSY